MDHTPDLATEVTDMVCGKRKRLAITSRVGINWLMYKFSYVDSRVSIAKQAIEKNLVTKAEFNPGSEQVRYTAERDGLLDIFEDLNAKIFTNACGPCIGQWARRC